MILFDKVTKLYNSHHTALEDVSLNINKGEFVTVVGQSGAGKSTLLKLLIAEEKATKGDIFFENIVVNKLSHSRLPHYRRRIGVVFQDFKLLMTKTVFENVAFAMEVAGYTTQAIERDVPEILDIVGIKDKSKSFPKELSGGEMQRVAIARALVHRPPLLLADEPTGNLDLINSWDIIRLLVKINELGTTVMLATHNREIVNSLNKRVITIDKGRVVRDQEHGKYMI